MSYDLFQYTVWVRYQTAVWKDGREYVAYTRWTPVITTIKWEADSCAKAFSKANPRKEYAVLPQSISPDEQSIPIAKPKVQPAKVLG